MIKYILKESFDIMPHPEREEYKRNAYSIINNAKTIEEKMQGIMMIIEAHWHRNRYNHKNLSFNDYASHWLWARDAEDNHQQIYNKLQKQYPPPKKPKIKKGYSNWNSYE